MNESTALFQRSWEVYRSVIDGNWMYHREIRATVAAWLDRAYSDGPLEMLDLGCGDAGVISQWLNRRPAVSYTGVDAAGEVLAMIPGRVSGLRDLVLITAAMEDFVRTVENRYEVVICSYAFHHLSAEAKKEFVSNVKRCLKPGGAFILVDVLRNDGESRDEAVASYVRMMQTTWTGIRPEHLSLACAHVIEHDFPETFESIACMAVSTGFAPSVRLAVHERHHALLFVDDDGP
jgi:cyclopropane fatty-acyl-phospholipid synthase-like methyltransferase